METPEEIGQAKIYEKAKAALNDLSNRDFWDLCLQIMMESTREKATEQLLENHLTGVIKELEL